MINYIFKSNHNKQSTLTHLSTQLNTFTKFTVSHIHNHYFNSQDNNMVNCCGQDKYKDGQTRNDRRQQLLDEIKSMIGDLDNRYFRSAFHICNCTIIIVNADKLLNSINTL